MAAPEFVDEPTGPLAGHPQALRPLTPQLVSAVLAARGYTCQAMPGSQLEGRWGGNLIRFRQLGGAGEVLQIQTLTDRRFPIQDVPGLHVFCNTWNRDRYWPKAFVVVGDDGQALVCGEVDTDLERGVTPHQLDRILQRGITAGCRLGAVVVELSEGTRR